MTTGAEGLAAWAGFWVGGVRSVLEDDGTAQAVCNAKGGCGQADRRPKPGLQLRTCRTAMTCAVWKDNVLGIEESATSFGTVVGAWGPVAILCTRCTGTGCFNCRTWGIGSHLGCNGFKDSCCDMLCGCTGCAPSFSPMLSTARVTLPMLVSNASLAKSC